MFDRVKKQVRSILGVEFFSFLKWENPKHYKNKILKGEAAIHTQTAAGAKLTKQISKRKIAIFFLLYIYRCTDISLLVIRQ